MILTQQNAHKELFNLRVKHGLSQLELAKITMLQPVTISRIELGKTVPSVKTLHKLLKFFNRLENYTYETLDSDRQGYC